MKYGAIISIILRAAIQPAAFLVVFALFTSSVFAAEGDLVWAKRAGDVNSDVGKCISALSDGSTVMTGIFEGTVTFGNSAEGGSEIDLISAGVYDIFVAKYNSDGTLAWAKKAGGDSYDGGYGISALSDGSAIVTGWFETTATFGNATEGGSEIDLTSAGTSDIFIAKYNSDGTLAWAKKAGGGSGDDGRALSTFSDGSAVVTGIFASVPATFGNAVEGGNETDLTSAGSCDIFIAKYNPNGTLAWAKRAGGESHDYGFGVSTLSDGSSIVTGSFLLTATFGNSAEGGNQVDFTADGIYSDMFVAKYNSNGTLAWAKHAVGGSTDSGQDITTLLDGSAIVTGNFGGSGATFGNAAEGGNEIFLTSSGTDDIFIAKYNSDGTLAWAKRAGGGSMDTGLAISALSGGSTYTTGWFSSTATFGNSTEGGSQIDLTAAGQADIFVAKYNADGTLAWAKREGGGAGDEGHGISLLTDGTVYVSGRFSTTATFGNATEGGNEVDLTSADGFDIFIASYEGTGPSTTFYWRGPGGTNWTNPDNWSPIPGGVVGAGSLEGANVVVEAAFNMPIMPTQNIVLNNIVINSGNSCTGPSGSFSCTVNGQISGGGSFTGGSGTLKLTKIGTGAEAPIQLGYDAFYDASGTVSYEGAGNQEIWADCTDYSDRYWNLNLAGSGTKSFNGNTLRVRRQLIVNGVTCSLDNSAQRVYVNTWRYNLEPAVELTGASQLTGDGQLYSFGNCNVGSTGSITISELELHSRNDGGSQVEPCHLNVASGASVSVGTFYAYQYGAHDNPINVYFNGPGTLNISGGLCVYSGGGDVTFWINGDITCGNLRPLSADNTWVNDLGEYTITVTSDAYGPGDIILDSGGDLNVADDFTLTGNLTIGHVNSVVDSDGEFDIGNLSMTAGELYIADDDASWTWNEPPTGGTIYYDGTDQNVWDDGPSHYYNSYYNLVLRGTAGSVKTTDNIPFDIVRSLTVENVTLSINDSDQFVCCNQFRNSLENAVDISGSGIITGVGRLRSYGNCNVGTGTISVREIWLMARDSDPVYLTIEPGGSVSRGGAGNFYPYGYSTNPCTVTYTGPGTLNYSNVQPVCTSGALFTFFVEGNVSCTDLNPYHANCTVDDAGSHAITATNCFGNGSIILDNGGELTVNGDCLLLGNLSIAHSDSFVNIVGEADNFQLIMNNGSFYVADEDPTFTIYNNSVPGGIVFYYRPAEQPIVPASYDYLAVANSGAKFLIGPTTVGTLNIMGWFAMNGQTLFVDKVIGMTTPGALFYSEVPTGMITDNGGGYAVIVTEGVLDVRALTVDGLNANGFNVTDSTIISNFDNITWQNGDPSASYLKLGNSTDLILIDKYWGYHSFDANCTVNVSCDPIGPHEKITMFGYSGAKAGEDNDSDSSVNGVEIVWDMDPVPLPPSAPLLNGRVNPTSLAATSVNFSAAYHDVGPVSPANAAWYQVDNDSDFGSLHYSSGWAEIPPVGLDARCEPVQYMGGALTSGVTYYWRIRFRNELGQVGDFSIETAYFNIAEYTQELPYKGYHLLDLPCKTGGKTFQQIFGDDISGALVIYCWNELLNKWDPVGANTAPLDNMGYRTATPTTATG
ncbi:MAG: hypothetical protein ACYS8W_03030 [Planctomycetota bacterium]